MTTTLTPDEFISGLENDTLSEVLPTELPTVLTVTGFVKSSGDGNLKFAPTRLCSAWIDIPREIIKSVEYHGKRPCAFGMYDFAAIELTIPVSDPIISAFAGLANAFSAPPPTAIPASSDHAGTTNTEIGNSTAMHNALAAGFPGASPGIPGATNFSWPRLPRPPRQVRCATCVAGFTVLAAGIVYWAVNTGDVLVVQGIIWEEFGVAISAEIVGSAIGGASAGYIASQLCPDCR